MIQLIIYDLDGTLIDSRRDIAGAVNWTLKELGRGELSLERVSSLVGSGVRNLMSQALEEAGAGKNLLERSIKLFRMRYGEHLLDHTRLYPSVRKVLEFFKAKKQAVITNKPAGFSLKILRDLGVDSYFFRVIGGDQGFPKKPAPAALLEILRESRLSPGEAVFVGDSAIDTETGRQAGVKTLGVTYGFGSPEEIGRSRPDGVLNDLEELIPCPLLKS